MSILLLLHLIAGFVACVSGLLALISIKGGILHRRSGQVFVFTLIVTAGGGAIYAIERPEALTGLVGVFTCYLVLSGFYTVTPRGDGAPIVELACVLVSTLLATMFFVFGMLAPAVSRDGMITPYVYFGFGVVAMLAAIGDISGSCFAASKGVGGSGGMFGVWGLLCTLLWVLYWMVQGHGFSQIV